MLSSFSFCIFGICEISLTWLDTWRKEWRTSSIRSKIIYGKAGVWDYQCYHCIETIPLVWSGNQWDGFYVMLTLAWNGNVECMIKVNNFRCFLIFPAQKKMWNYNQPGRWVHTSFQTWVMQPLCYLALKKTLIYNKLTWHLIHT